MLSVCRLSGTWLWGSVTSFYISKCTTIPLVIMKFVFICRHNFWYYQAFVIYSRYKTYEVKSPKKKHKVKLHSPLSSTSVHLDSTNQTDAIEKPKSEQNHSLHHQKGTVRDQAEFWDQLWKSNIKIDKILLTKSVKMKFRTLLESDCALCMACEKEGNFSSTIHGLGPVFGLMLCIVCMPTKFIYLEETCLALVEIPGAHDI